MNLNMGKIPLIKKKNSKILLNSLGLPKAKIANQVVILDFLGQLVSADVEKPLLQVLLVHVDSEDSAVRRRTLTDQAKRLLKRHF